MLWKIDKVIVLDNMFIMFLMHSFALFAFYFASLICMLHSVFGIVYFFKFEISFFEGFFNHYFLGGIAKSLLTVMCNWYSLHVIWCV